MPQLPIPTVLDGGNHRKTTSEEEDQKDRTAKKSRTEPEDQICDSEMTQGTVLASDSGAANVHLTKPSYKDKVIAGEFNDPSFSPHEIIDLVREELCVGDPMDAIQEMDKGPFNPNPVVPISLEEYEEWCRPWKFSLVVKLLGKRIGFKWMNQRLHHLWARNGEIKVIDLTDDYFLIRFNSEKDYHFALFEGPWMIADHYLLVQRWRPMFRADDSQVRKIAVWVRIPKLSAELYNNTFLWRAGSLLGTMLKIDMNTSAHSRGKFARICIEVDLNRQLVPTFTALGEEHIVEYEGLHSICFSCGRYGHKSENCVETKLKDSTPVNTAVSETSPMAQEDQPMVQPVQRTDAEQMDQNLPRFGPWMVAKKNSRKKPSKPSYHGSGEQSNGSRFQSLGNENVEEEQALVTQVRDNQEPQPPSHGQNLTKNGKKIPKPTNRVSQQPKTGGPGHSGKKNHIVSKSTQAEIKEHRVPVDTTNIIPKKVDDSSPDLSKDEFVMLEAMRRQQFSLWEDYKAGRTSGNELCASTYVPSKEELQFVHLLLHKKGVGDPNFSDTCYNQNIQDDTSMEEESSQPSL